MNSSSKPVEWYAERTFTLGRDSDEPFTPDLKRQIFSFLDEWSNLKAIVRSDPPSLTEDEMLKMASMGESGVQWWLSRPKVDKLILPTELGYWDYNANIDRAIAEETIDGQLPKLHIPTSMLSEFNAKALEGLARTEVYFMGSKGVVKLGEDSAGAIVFVEVEPEGLQEGIEKVFRVCKPLKDDGKPNTDTSTILSKEAAKRLLHSEHLNLLPEIQRIVDCPVIDNQGRVCDLGYHSGVAGGTYVVKGQVQRNMSVARSRELLETLLVDYDFVTESDRTRALASFLTPALAQGGILAGRVPVAINEADSSQSGKTLLHQMVCAVYNNEPLVIPQHDKGAVGGLSESFGTALSSGRPFILLDNFRQKIDSPFIEAALTSESIGVRMPHKATFTVRIQGISFMLTSNGADLTPDLANRCSIVRIKHRPVGYQFQTYPEGGILQHVRENQAMYLGAVFTILRAWVLNKEHPRRRTDLAKHDFVEWSQTLDAIMKDYFARSDLMEGHREVQVRTSTRIMTELREIGLAYVKEGIKDKMRASSLVEFAEDRGLTLTLRGETTDAKAKSLGSLLKPLYEAIKGDSLTVDNLRLQRAEDYDDDGKHLIKRYWFIEKLST